METKKFKVSEIIECFVSGDWGNEAYSLEYPNEIRCVRGADIVPIWNNDFSNIPVRYVSDQALIAKSLQVGDIIIEKSGGSPTQSTGRTAFVSKELLGVHNKLFCSNFCTAFRVKKDWNPKYVFYYLQHIYKQNVFFNFEGKTSGLKNLQIGIAFQSIEITQIPRKQQDDIVRQLDTLDQKISLNRSINQNLAA